MSELVHETAGLGDGQLAANGSAASQAAQFERLVTELSNALVMTPAERIDSGILRWMERAAEFLGCEGSAIPQFAEDGRSGRITHIWLAPGIPALPASMGNQEWPWVFEELKKGRPVAFLSPEELPPEARIDARTYLAIGVRSCITVPLARDGKNVGGFCMATFTKDHTWPDELVRRVRLVGELLGGALARLRAYREIRGNVERLAEAQRIAHLGSWEWDLLNDELKWSDEVYRIFDLDPRQFRPSMDAFWTFVHPDDVAVVRREAQRATAGPRGIYSVDHRIVHRDGSCRMVRELGVPEFDRDGRAVRLAGTIQDVTEIHAAYEEIRRLKEQLEAENVYLREELSSVTGYGEIVGTSDVIRRVIIQAQQVAPTDATVLILGETGTGKELLAHFIHGRSPRKNRPFITTNLAAIPVTLIESELFGREKGAFTGALTRQIGRFEAADGGTIFLDEIGEMPAETQAKLLRVLQSGEFERLGNSKTMRVNVRVIAATNRDLAAAVGAGTFRQDLYYRLNVFPITVPPLRDRREDIPQLAWAFIKEFGEKMGKPIDHIKRTSMAALQAYPWPGNIRELRNVVERSMILTQGQELNVTLPGAAGPSQDVGVEMRDVERQHIRHILEVTKGRIRGKGGAAELLGLKPSTLYARMKKLDIRRDA